MVTEGVRVCSLSVEFLSRKLNIALYVRFLDSHVLQRLSRGLLLLSVRLTFGVGLALQLLELVLTELSLHDGGLLWHCATLSILSTAIYVSSSREQKKREEKNLLCHSSPVSIKEKEIRG